MSHYYNEWEPHAAAWLRNLISAGHLPAGDVDERSIADVAPSDLIGYTQCHFFAGIGGWALAARMAGWPDDRPLWTGSCPCQPFSVAGSGKGHADDRHLWPEWFRLIQECRPPNITGEQVEAAINHGWLDLVQTDLEAEGYAFAPIGLPAAGVGASHGRARLWFVADNWRGRREVASEYSSSSRSSHSIRQTDITGVRGILGDVAHHHQRLEGREPVRQRGSELVARENSVVGRMADYFGQRRTREHALLWPEEAGRIETALSQVAGSGETYWSRCDWVPCRDGKWRPVEPGTFPLAHGVPNRVGRLRAYGNAIVPQVAAEVIRAWMECAA